MRAKTFSIDTLLSIMTMPFLVSLLGAKAMADLMQGVGLLSEELFRGDRLPVLNRDPSSDSSDTVS